MTDDVTMTSHSTAPSIGADHDEQERPGEVPGLQQLHELEAPSMPRIVPPTKREREAQVLEDASDRAGLPARPLAELRVLANRLFRIMEADHPPLFAYERYLAVTGEIQSRVDRITARNVAGRDREVFKNSPYNSRFELYCDGSLAAYVRYSMMRGELTLRTLTEKPGFEDRGFGRTLLRHAMLDAHRRRLRVVPGCPAVRAFLEQHPQYLALSGTFG